MFGRGMTMESSDILRVFDGNKLDEEKEMRWEPKSSVCCLEDCKERYCYAGDVVENKEDVGVNVTNVMHEGRLQ